MNNQGYQILKNRLKLFHGNDKPIGMDFQDPPMDVTKIAEGFGVTAERVDTADVVMSASIQKNRPSTRPGSDLSMQLPISSGRWISKAGLRLGTGCNVIP